jgi:hypothetical protein
MDFGAVTTPTAEELLGRKPLTLRTWVERNSQAVLEAGARAPLAARPRLFDPARRTMSVGPGQSIHEGGYHGQRLVDYR